MKKIFVLILSILFCFLTPLFAAEKAENAIYTPKEINKIIKSQDNALLDKILQQGYNPDSAFANMPMTYLSLYHKNNDALLLFLSYGAKIHKTVPPMFVSKNKENLLTYAIYQKNFEGVEILLDRGFDPNKMPDKYTPLNYAIIKKQPEIVKILLDYGAEPDSITYELVNRKKYEKLKPLFY